jgi:hypothetical protein
MKPAERRRTAARMLGASALPGTLAVLFSAKSLAMGAAVGIVTVAAVTHRVPWSSTTQRTIALPPATAAGTHTQRSHPTPTAPPEPTAAPVQTPMAEPPMGPPMAAPKVTPAVPRASQSHASNLDATEREIDALEREASLLESARASLANAPARALELVERHAASFPNGKLAVERELVAVDALERLGRRSEARARGEALLRRASGNIYEDRIRRLLEKMP